MNKKIIINLLRLSNFHILFVFGLFIYLIGILILNADRGFDVTDESYYILNAMYPFNVFSVITHENYYTGLLFYLSGYNLSIFRIFGIIILVLASFWFAVELYKYIEKKYQLNYDIYNKLYFVLIISLSSLAYYMWWLLTPSYNWFSLVAMILILASMFRCINSINIIRGKLFSLEYFYVGVSLSLLFIAKPTSLLGLLPAFLFFIIFNYKKIDFFKAIVSISFVFIFIIILHIIFFDGGFSNYITNLKESIERLSLLGGGHTFKDIFISIYENAKNIYFQINKCYLFIYLLFSLLITRYFYSNNLFLLILSFIFTSYFAYILYLPVIIPFDVSSKFYITILFFSIYIFSIYISNENNIKEKFKIFFQSFSIFIFLSYLSIAVSFGTNNNIWFHSNISYIFPVAGIISLVFILDKYHSMIKNLKIIVGIVISLSIYIIIDNAYKNPYRLNTSIKEQIHKIDILGGLKVDDEQKNYINQLSSIKNNYRQTYLIDTTGATPGANIILEAKFFQFAWLGGGYTGSNEFAYRILSSISYDKLKNAWILTAPGGIRSLDLNLLSKLGLNFPEDYDKATTLFLKSRNEIQELWKPKEIFNVK